MKYKEIIHEWYHVTTEDINFSFPDFSVSEDIGIISTRIGDISLKKIDNDPELIFGAFVEDEPIAYIGLLNYQSCYMAKNALTKNEYKKKGIISEIIRYLVNNIGMSIISDLEMSPDGGKLWHSLTNSPYLKSGIFYVPTRETFSLPLDGTESTADGNKLILPENDNKVPYMWGGDGDNTGQRYFYILSPRLNETFVKYKQQYLKNTLFFNLGDF